MFINSHFNFSRAHTCYGLLTPRCQQPGSCMGSYMRIVVQLRFILSFEKRRLALIFLDFPSVVGQLYFQM